MKYWIAAACFFSIIGYSVTGYAQLRLPAILASGMVLQQNDSVSLWGWGGPGTKVFITNSWNGQTDSAKVSSGARWLMRIKTPSAGGPFTLSIKNNSVMVLDDVMIGEVWVCSGQSNMEMSYSWGEKDIATVLATAENKNIRFFHIPRTTSDYPQDDVKAKWTICDSNTIKTFSAVAYFFGRKLEENLHVPIGLINSTWGGTPAEAWAPASMTNNDSVLKTSATHLPPATGWPIEAGSTYNGMIAPIIHFSIAGAIWYQGEGNTPNGATYGKLFSGMIGSWRKAWQKEIPFYYVQIAPYNYGNRYVGAIIQEQQANTMAYPRVGMVVTTDLIDSVTNIHPTHKRAVGYRLANWALADNYHIGGIVYKSPSLKSVEKKKGELVLSFENVPNGLMATTIPVTGFLISGDNEAWVPADAKIEKNQIVVSNKLLKEPVFVRYGFDNALAGNVFSTEGLPLIPFRTDRWPLDQSAVK